MNRLRLRLQVAILYLIRI